jgi:hypothetical protein
MKMLGSLSVQSFFWVVPSQNSAICMIGVLRSDHMIRVEKFILSHTFAINADGVINSAYDHKRVLSVICIVIILINVFPSVSVIVWVMTLFPGCVNACSIVSVVFLVFVSSQKSQSTCTISL